MSVLSRVTFELKSRRSLSQVLLNSAFLPPSSLTSPAGIPHNHIYNEMYPQTTLRLRARRHALSASPLRRFPDEVLGACFAFLQRHDLASVVRVCHCFYIEGQIYLYKFVELSNELPNVQETIALLGTLPVGAYVQEAVLTTTTSRTAAYPAWFPTNIAQNWVRLRRLELSGVPFATSQDIDLFSATLQEHCRKLQSLAYRHDPSLDFPGGESGILGERSGSRDHVLDGNANKSAHSLTHIAFTGSVFHSIDSSFDTFIKLRFSNLKSLELGTLAVLSGSVPYATTTTSVTRFLVEHNTIEHLSLGKKLSRSGLFFHLDGSLITADVLPKLRSFEGCSPTITILVQSGVRSIFALTSLSLLANENFEENLYDISAMVDTIKSSSAQALTSVRDLKVKFFPIVTPLRMRGGIHAMSSSEVEIIRQRSCLDQMAGVFPNVVNFAGTFPAMCASRFKTMFALYHHLETISVPWYTLLVYMKPSGETTYFAPLVEALPSLNAVVARKQSYTTSKDQVFTFVRNPAGALSYVLREEVRLAGSSSWM